MILAAGGLVWRAGPEHRLVCLVHRQRYDDWSLPKGSVKRGEHPLAAAVREVTEETGQRGVPQLPLPPTRYEVDGVPKLVEYWAMTAASRRQFRPNSEVDQLIWLPVGEAVRRVRYPHDAELLLRWDGLPPVTAVVLLVRHADAGKRSQWSGPDRSRPLSQPGVADAEALCRLLQLFLPDRLISAAPDRCRQTIAPLAGGSRPVAVDPVFDEVPGDPDATAARVEQLAGAGATTVVCTQGGVLPPLLGRLAGDGAGRTGPDWTTAKGDGWLLSFAGRQVLAVAPLRARRVHQ